MTRLTPMLVVAAMLLTISAIAQEPPMSPAESVVDTYHGVTVADPFRWLEDGTTEEVKAWTAKQNAYAREFLDRLSVADRIRPAISEIMGFESPSYGGLSYRAGKYFVMKSQPPKQQPFLVRLDGLGDDAQSHVLVDPNELDPAGTTSIDWYEPSPNGKYLAVSLSRSGTEAGDVHLFDTDTGKMLDDMIPRVNTGTAGGDLAWAPDSSGFYYTRHPREGERPVEDLNFFQQLFFHKLGEPTESDRYELGKDFPRIAEIEVETDSQGQVLANVQNGDGGQFAHYLRTVDGSWHKFSGFEDRHVQATFGPADDILVVSFEDASRGKILKCSIDELDLAAAQVLIPEGEQTIVTSFYHAPPSVLSTASRLYVTYQLGGPSEVRVFDHAGKQLSPPQQPTIGSVGGLTALESGKIAFEAESYVTPPAFFVFDADRQLTTQTVLASRSPVNFDDVEVVREYATSQDGTQVPINLLVPSGTVRDGSHPAIMYGYGGFGISLEPRFNPALRVLLDQGLIYGIANLRGGGEYGETWHNEGRLTRKQNVFDDFAAALDHVVQRGYTRPERLGTLGGSNGGLLMGAALTQYPDKMKAVVSLVGIYDMLRVELSSNGAFNIPEFGTVQDLEQFQALRAYSPYHNVKAGNNYPAVLFITGANDPRVDPMQSRKMTARLQTSTGSGRPILLRTNAKAGHGGDTSLSDRIEQAVDMYAFFLSELGD